VQGGVFGSFYVPLPLFGRGSGAHLGSVGRFDSLLGPIGLSLGLSGFVSAFLGPGVALCRLFVSVLCLPGGPFRVALSGRVWAQPFGCLLLLGRGGFAVPVLVAWPLGWGGASPYPPRGCCPSSWGFALPSGRMPLSSSNLYFFFCYSGGDARQYYLKTVSQVLFP